MTIKAQRRKSKSPKDRFWKNVREAEGDGCWEWIGGRDKLGYGHVYVGGKTPGGSYRHMRAHRVSWEMHFGKIPDGIFVCHRCDNPSCVRPDHLFLGTSAENMADMVAKGRSSKRPGLEHPCFNPANHAPTDGHWHKLHPIEAQAILSRYQAGGVTQQQLADEYHVHYSTVSLLVNGKRWKELAS